MRQEKEIEDDIRFVSNFDIISQVNTANSYVFPHLESKQVFHSKPIFKRPIQVAPPEQVIEVTILHIEDLQANPDAFACPSIFFQEFEANTIRKQSHSLRSILVRNRKNKEHHNSVHFQLEEDKLIFSDMILGSSNDFALE